MRRPFRRQLYLCLWLLIAIGIVGYESPPFACRVKIRLAPFFSVVIPVHNRRDLLTRALDSIKIQNFSSYEVICVDDHSTDGFEEDVAARGDNFQVFPLTGCSGQHCARARGVEVARGEYIVAMDSDDSLLPGIFWALSREIDRSPDNIDIFWYTSLEWDGVKDSIWNWGLPPSSLVKNVVKIFQKRPLAWELWGKAIRRTTYLAGLSLLTEKERNASLNVAVDLLHSSCIFLKTRAIRYLPKLTGYRYFRDTRESCTNHPNNLNMSIVVLSLCGDIYKRETGKRPRWINPTIRERQRQIAKGRSG